MRARTSPMRRLARMPAAMRVEAARLERGGVEAAAGAAAFSGASFIARRILIHWKKFACGDFFETLRVGRRQKAWFLPPTRSRSYARTAKGPERDRVSQRRHRRNAVLPAPSCFAFHSIDGAWSQLEGDRLLAHA